MVKKRSNGEIERTRLANERTLLAYIRTAMAFLIFGVAIMKFFANGVAIEVGITVIILGVLCFLYGLHVFNKRRQEYEHL